jgi:hypothetical protein
MSNLFELAAVSKFRFPSSRGDLTVENLIDLPLQSRQGFDLDSVAKEVSRALKAVTEESFVATRSNPAKAELEAKLELVKYIISVKLEQKAAAASAAAKASERAKLVGILGEKQDEVLKGLTPAELAERIAALG